MGPMGCGQPLPNPNQTIPKQPCRGPKMPKWLKIPNNSLKRIGCAPIRYVGLVLGHGSQIGKSPVRGGGKFKVVAPLNASWVPELRRALEGPKMAILLLLALMWGSKDTLVALPSYQKNYHPSFYTAIHQVTEGSNPYPATICSCVAASSNVYLYCVMRC